MKPFDKYHLNFSKLVKLLESDTASEEEFLELLKNPPTPNGVFSAYYHTKTYNLIYSIATEEETTYHNIDGTVPNDASFLEFIGSYASLDDLFESNPSYLI